MATLRTGTRRMPGRAGSVIGGGGGYVRCIIRTLMYNEDMDPVPNLPLTAMQQVVSDLYSYSLKIVGLAVFVMFLIAGLTYIIPGLKSKFGEPMDIIKNAVIGLILLFSAYLILNTINPDLVGNETQQSSQNQTIP